MCGMLSQEEMRTNPPGAVDKHLNWEKANKQNIAKWKNLMLRMNVGTEDQDLCNIERLRPTKSTMNMDGAQVSRTQYFMPPPGADLPTAFSEAELKQLRELAPGIAERLGLLDNGQRREVKDALNTGSI